VTNTQEAANVFDKICYRKGALFLRQIGYYLGPKALLEAVANYMEKFSYKTTELKDFMECFDQAY
jgi:aminopeptidase N